MKNCVLARFYFLLLLVREISTIAQFFDFDFPSEKCTFCGVVPSVRKNCFQKLECMWFDHKLAIKTSHPAILLSWFYTFCFVLWFSQRLVSTIFFYLYYLYTYVDLSLLFVTFGGGGNLILLVSCGRIIIIIIKFSSWRDITF